MKKNIIVILTVFGLILDSGIVIAVPEIVEDGWQLFRTDSLNSCRAAHYNPIDGLLYTITENGLYRINIDRTIDKIVSLDRPSGIAIDPDDGDILISEHYGGKIFHIEFNSGLKTIWINNLHSGDSDPTGLAIIPNDYTGDVVDPGMGLVIDRDIHNSNRYDSIWQFSPDISEDLSVIHSDDGTLIDGVDVTVSDKHVYIADGGIFSPSSSYEGRIFELTTDGRLSRINTTKKIYRPYAITVDPLTNDLVVLDDNAKKVVRVNPTTGNVDDIVIFESESIFRWSSLDITPDGKKLIVTDTRAGKIYTFKKNSYPLATVNEISLSPLQAVLTQPNAEIRFLLRGYLSNGEITSPDNAVWHSSDTDVVIIDEDRAMAVGEGSAVITAKVGELSAQAMVTVQFDPISIDVAPKMAFWEVGETVVPTIYAFYPDGFQKELTGNAEYLLTEIGSLNLLQIDGESITALSAGNGEVEVTYDDLSTSFRFSVTDPVPLNITPAVARLKQSNSFSIKIDGGTPPYFSSFGTIKQSFGEHFWNIVAPNESREYVYTLQDSSGQEVDFKLTVLSPLELQYGDKDFGVRSPGQARQVNQRGIKSGVEPVILTVSGGTPPFSWQVTAGEVTVENSGADDQSVALYTPPDMAGIYTVTVVDSGGQVQDIKVSTIDPLQTDPEILYLAPGENCDVSIFGGTGPYSVEAFEGSVTQPQFFEKAGVGFFSYTAPTTVGEYMISVKDNEGVVVRLYATVALTLTVSPSHVYLRKGESQAFQLAGGVGKDDDIHILALHGAVEAHPEKMQFNYLPSESALNDVITITDLSGDQATATIEIITEESNISSKNFFVTPSSATVLKNENRRFKAIGGQGQEIIWHCEVGEGTISGQGQPSISYSAPDLVMTTGISAKDFANHEAGAEIYVIADDVLISPSQVFLRPGQQTEFQGNFGTGNYTFFWTEGDGVMVESIRRGAFDSNRVDTLLYTAPTQTGTHYITLFDSGGNSDKAVVVVSGGFKRDKIKQTMLFEITNPATLPNSETQPVAVGDVQSGGKKFSMAIDLPNYEDEDGHRIPTNFYVVGFFPDWNLFLLFDNGGGIYFLDELAPSFSEVTDAVYEQGLTFDFCNSDGPISMEIFVVAVASEHDPHGNLSFEPEDAPFELWYFDFSFPKCQ